MLVRGQGRYTDDVSLPGQAYAVMVRSRHAHGMIRGIDTEAAAQDARRARRSIPRPISRPTARSNASCRSKTATARR